MPFRRWQSALVFFASSFFVSSQVLSQDILVKAQNPETFYATQPAKLILGGKEYSSAQEACDSRLTPGYSVTVVPARIPPHLLCRYVYQYPNGDLSAPAYVNLFVQCPDSYQYIGSEKGGICAQNSLANEDELPDYSPCSYYDEIARTNNCKYHARAARICRDQDTKVNFFTAACSRATPGQITELEKNCIRSCLVVADQAARTAPSCQISCNGEICTKKNCINDYHKTCFSSCGVTPACFGGTWFLPYDNDEDKCLVKLDGGICLIRNGL